MKLAETYYLESKLPKAFLNLGILWRDGLLGSKQRYQNAIKFFLSSNLPVGKYNAAILYRDGLTGDNMPQSQRDEKAVSLLLEVESSLPLAKAVLGCMYRLAKKYAEAEKSLTAACEHNIASAFHNLGLMYHLSETGFTLSKWDREQKALSLFTKAFNLSGSTESKIQLEASKCQIAAMLINNTAGQQEGSQEERDKEAFRLLCECDGAESKLFKGSMLLEGRALLDLSEEVRYKSAQECFECSKTPDALHYLGIMYHFGKAGKELSKENRLNKAIELYRASDTLLAKADLGLLLYENPEAELSSPGKERDQVICELLQDSGTNIGKTGLGAMYIHGRAGKNLTQFERDQKAILLFNEAQTPAAYNNLAKLYIEERLGTDLPNSKRIQQAIDCFAKAIQPSGKFKEGCATAYLNLGLLYIIEEEIRDIGHALHLFHLAALAGIEQGAVYRDTLLKYCFVNEDFSSLANLKEIFFSHKNTASSSQINETSLQEKVLVNTNSKEGLGEKEVNESKFSQNSEIKISTNSSKDLKSLKKQLKQYNPDAKTKKRLFKKSLKNELTREEKSQLLSGDVKTSHNKIKIEFIGKAEKQYESWRKSNSYHASKIDDLIRVAFINPDSKRGKPEALDGDLAGWWSRRIDDEHRLVYKLTPDSILIKSCKKHYY